MGAVRAPFCAQSVCAPLAHLSVTASSRRHAPRLAASVAPLAKLPTEAAPLTTEMSPRGPSSLTWGGRRVSGVRAWAG